MLLLLRLLQLPFLLEYCEELLLKLALFHFLILLSVLLAFCYSYVNVELSYLKAIKSLFLIKIPLLLGATEFFPALLTYLLMVLIMTTQMLPSSHLPQILKVIFGFFYLFYFSLKIPSLNLMLFLEKE